MCTYIYLYRNRTKCAIVSHIGLEKRVTFGDRESCEKLCYQALMDFVSSESRHCSGSCSLTNPTFLHTPFSFHFTEQARMLWAWDSPLTPPHVQRPAENLSRFADVSSCLTCSQWPPIGQEQTIKLAFFGSVGLGWGRVQCIWWLGGSVPFP